MVSNILAWASSGRRFSGPQVKALIIIIVLLSTVPMLVGAACGIEARHGEPSDEARQHYNEGIKLGVQAQYAAAVGQFDEAIRLHPGYPQAYFARGVARDELGQYQRAIEDYNSPISSFPQPLCPPPCVTYDILYVNRAVSYANLGQYERAIEDLDEAIRLNPHNAAAYNNRGGTYTEQGRYQMAIQDLDEAVRLNPQFVEAYAIRALAYTSLGREQEAARDIARAVDLGFDRESLMTLIEIAKNQP